MSAPEPGPSGKMNFTVLLGQDCAMLGKLLEASASNASGNMAISDQRRRPEATIQTTIETTPVLMRNCLTENVLCIVQRNLRPIRLRQDWGAQGYND